MLQYDYPSRSSRDVEQTFGPVFAETLFRLGAEVTWQGPIASSYGYHVVRVTNRAESVLPEATAVQERVRQDFESERRERANEAYLQSLLARYDVTIEDPPGRSDSLSSVASRVAQRNLPDDVMKPWPVAISRRLWKNISGLMRGRKGRTEYFCR